MPPRRKENASTKRKRRRESDSDSEEASTPKAKKRATGSSDKGGKVTAKALPEAMQVLPTAAERKVIALAAEASAMQVLPTAAERKAITLAAEASLDSLNFLQQADIAGWPHENKLLARDLAIVLRSLLERSKYLEQVSAMAYARARENKEAANDGEAPGPSNANEATGKEASEGDNA